jgi:hypothetical protein
MRSNAKPNERGGTFRIDSGRSWLICAEPDDEPERVMGIGPTGVTPLRYPDQSLTGDVVPRI